MVCVSAGTYLAMSSLRSAKILLSGPMSALGTDSSRERHFIKAVASGQRSEQLRRCGHTTNYSLHARHLHSRQSPREAGLAHLLEHLLHLRILAKQIVHFLDGRTRSAGDAFAAVAVDDFMMIALV